MVNELYFEKTLLDRSLHRLDHVDEYISYILCFPNEVCRELDDRLGLLKKHGFIGLVEYGYSFMGYRFIGKGYSSINVLALNKHHGLGLLKIRRIDGRRGSLEREGMVLDYLDASGYTPRLYLWCREYIFMEYLGYCVDLVEYLDKLFETGERALLAKVLLKLFTTMYFFDIVGVDHGELNRPYKHVYWCNGFVKVIDWESSSFSRKPHNLSSILSYLYYRYRYRDRLYEYTGLDETKLSRVLKTYKSSYSIKKIIDLIKSLERFLENPS